jgi:hypothetical protein
MGSYKHPRIFLPLDLQIVDMVYDAAWAHIVNNDPFRDTTHDGERKEALREKVIALAQGSVDFDTLLNAVLRNISEPRAILVSPNGKGFSKPRAN